MAAIGKIIARRGLACALLAGISVAALAAGAEAQTAASAVSVPAGPLESGMLTLGRQANLRLLYPTEITRGKRTGGVGGNLAGREAVAQLLAGTGLSFRFTGENTVQIFDPAAPQVVQSGAASAADIGVDADSATSLETIVIRSGGGDATSGSGFQGTPDWVYETPASVSVVSREAIVSSPARNTRDLLDNIAGVVINRSEAQNPGIVISMRGVQDQDRIATMIDGARQSFQRGGHGATQRAYVESAFLRGIEVEKTTGSGVGGIGALAGSVNFRTVKASDLIRDGRDWGMELNATTGSNAYHFDGSVMGAWRPSEYFAVTAGLSAKSIGAYQIGRNGSVLQNTTYDGDIMLFSGQKVKTGLLKFEIDPTDDLSLTLSWMRNNSDFSTGYYTTFLGINGVVETEETVKVDTLTASASWNPQDNDLIDLKARIYHNRLENVSHASVLPNSYTYKTTGGSIENTSRWDIGRGMLALHYGGEAFRDTGETSLGHHWLGTENVADLISGATPNGGRSMVSGFTNVSYEDDILFLQGGLRYDWYHTEGSTTFFNRTRDLVEIKYHPAVPCTPRPTPQRPDRCTGGSPERWENVYTPWYYKGHDVEIDRSGGTFLPNVKVAVKPAEWLQVFAGYSKSYRPPTVMESFINGSAHQNSVTEFAPNPWLEPERGRTFEIGANITADGLFTENDKLRVKITRFNRRIDDYIAYGRMNHPLTAGDASFPNYTTFVNLIDETRMRGVELEANYDAGFFYVGGNATWLTSDFGLRYRSFNVDGSTRIGYLFDDTAPVVFIAPDRKFTLDAGVRLLDERLTLGAKMTKVSATEPIFGQLARNNTLPGYTTYDIYGSFKFSEDAVFRAAVTNVTDKAYVSALGATYYAAPGRTLTASLNFKF